MTHAKSSKIGVATATIIVMNAMIGAGIFSAPAAMAAHVGPAGILAYILVVISVWFMALSMARLTELYPEEGSFYTYAKQWGGHYVGLIACISYFIGLLIAMGLLAQMSGTYLHALIPHVSAYTLGLATLGIIVLINLFGVPLSQLGQHILIFCTLFSLLAITFMCLFKAKLSNLTPFAPYGFTNVFKATRVVIFGFFGFEAAASLFNIVQEPHKNVPRALTYSIAIVGALYTLFVASLILAIPLENFTNPNVPLTDVMRTIFPQNSWMLTLILLAILSAIIGTVHSMVWSSSALLVTLTKKIFPKSKTDLPIWAAALIVGLCILITFVSFKNIDLFFYFTAIFLIVGFILSMITLLTLKKEWKSGQNIKTLLGITTACAILYFAIEGVIKEVAKIM